MKGNTQPGGFYNGGYGDENDSDDEASPQKAKPKANYNDPAKYAGTGQPAPFMGDATTKMYLNFVNVRALPRPCAIATHHTTPSDRVTV